MNMVIVLIMGFILGAGTLYLLQVKDLDRLDDAEAELKQARRALTEAEANHETRLKEAIAAVQTEYKQKHELEVQSITLDLTEKIQNLKAQLRAKEDIDIPAPIIPLDLTDVPPTSSVTPETMSDDPPILVADIHYGANATIPLSEPSGKQITPPILAQSVEIES